MTFIINIIIIIIIIIIHLCISLTSPVFGTSSDNRHQIVDTLSLNGVYSFRDQNNPHPPLSPPLKVGVFAVFYK